MKINDFLKALSFFAILSLVMSCKPEPKKIEYGVDICNYCKMTIVEETHAAEIVTKKGRAYKYDAIECMINEINGLDKNKIALFLVTDYVKPKTLINAKEATFLISEEIKSPMGAFLTAFASKENAKKYNGKIFNWEKIQKEF